MFAMKGNGNKQFSTNKEKISPSYCSFSVIPTELLLSVSTLTKFKLYLTFILGNIGISNELLT